MKKKAQKTQKTQKTQGQHFLGNGTTVDGTLTCNGQIRIDGGLKGDISVNGPLIVGAEAMIKADIHATSIYVSGEIHGSITADQVVEISPSGKVYGKIHVPTLVIDEGAVFDGQCRMSGAEELRERKLVPIVPDRSDEERFLEITPATSRDDQVAGGNG